LPTLSIEKIEESKQPKKDIKIEIEEVKD